MGDDANAAAADQVPQQPDFYLRYYVGHAGRFGHEFLEFELRDNGTLRYANHSRYRDKGSNLIKKQVTVTAPVLEEFKRLVRKQQVMQCSDDKWPQPDRSGRQELEILVDGEHVSFATNTLCLMAEIRKLEDADGFLKFFYAVQDLKTLTLALIQTHHRIRAL